jgi:hypothetical protein
MHLKSLEVGVPGGWHDVCPYCGNHSVGITFGQLVGRVSVHYSNMKHPIAGSLEDEVEARICAALKPPEQVAYCQTGVRQRTAVRWGEVVSFLTWLTTWFAAGRELVPHAEAERRASICASCPYNIAISGCGVCRKTINVFRSNILKAEPVSTEVKLNACSVCGCDLKSLVHIPLDTLKSKNHDYSKVSWCWQNPNSPNVG